MTRLDRLKRNPRLLFWGRALVEMKTLNVVAVLFYLHRGLAIDQVFYLSIFFAVTSLLFEVPSGYLADRVGRKKTLLLGLLFYILGFAMNFIAHDFWVFGLVFIFASLGYACFSGTEEALLFDSLKEAGEERKMNQINGKLHSASHLIKIFSPILGVLIAQNLLEWQFQALIAIDVLAAFVAMGVFSLLVEPSHKEQVLVRELGVYQESLKTIRQHPFLFRAAMNRTMLFLVSFVIWRLYQPYLFNHGVSVLWLGVFYVILQLVLFSSKWFVGALDEKYGTASLLFWTTIGTLVCLFPLLFVQAPWLLFLFLILVISISSLRTPIFALGMNHHISSRSRSTTLSNLNVFMGAFEIPLMLTAGWFARTNLEYVFVIAILMCLATLVLFPMREEDFVPPFAENELPD